MQQAAATTFDVAAVNHGSIWTLAALTDAGRKWLDEHLIDPPRWGVHYVVEHRYIDAIVNGMLDDGIAVH